MLVICVVGGRLVERFRGNFFSLGQTMLVAKLALSKNSQVSWDGPLLVLELCSAMFGLEAGALGRRGGRGREPELVLDCTCVV